MTRTLLASLAVLVACAAPAAADGSWAPELARELMSPFCPGVTLDACTSNQAETLRLWIQVQEAAGRSRADVEAELVERYGDVVLAAPRAAGLGLAAYLVPAAAFLAGGLGVALFLRRQTRRRSERPAPVAVAPPDPELERLVDEELAR